MFIYIITKQFYAILIEFCTMGYNTQAHPGLPSPKLLPDNCGHNIGELSCVLTL